MPDLNELFGKYREKKIALYGLGTETERALAVLDATFKIIGLLDSFRETGEIYGKKILSFSRAVEYGTELIIVVARPGSCKAIVRRIGDFCREKGILLIDIRGKDLLEKRKIVFGFPDIKGQTKEELYRKIENAEVVSFDLFDTLVMREVLFCTDVLELMSAVLKEKGIVIPDFVSRRLTAEKELARFGAPSLESIYQYMLDKMEKTPVSPAELARIEWETDMPICISRQAVCDIFSYCIQKKKKVYIVTDTYYRSKQIKELLHAYHLTGYKGLLVSCEYKKGKMQGLFQKLKSIEGKKRYLHLGDDLVADIEMAQNMSMDTYHIYSKEQLLDTLGGMGMESYIQSIADRVKAGMLAARLFNNPFQFETGKNVIEIKNAYDIGYIICAPIITDFMIWFQEKVQEEAISNIFFSARDGYLPQKLYQFLDKKTNSIYFMTSRISAVRAGMENEKDIAYVDSMKFSGTICENLEARFGLDDDTATDENGAGLMKYKKVILKNADVQRERFRKYINNLDIKSGDIAFFDFVAKGTTQMYTQRLLENHLKGLYFLQLEPEFMSDKELDIIPFYGLDETDPSGIFDDYYILETILTAPHPSVCGFDENGKVEFTEETRREHDIRCIQRVQEGVLEYFKRYLAIVPESIRGQSRKLDGVILGLVHRLKVTDEEFRALTVEDPFFNRETGMTDLI